MRRLVFWLVLGLILGLTPVAGMPAAHAAPPPEVRFDQRLEESLPLDLTFTDASGRASRLESYFGARPVAIAMVQYGCPNLCTHILNGLIKSLSEQRFDVGRALTVLVVSLDPHETPEDAEVRRQLTLKRYGRAGTEDGWQFMTGDEASIRRLAEALGIHYSYDAKTQQYAHPAGITIVTPQGRIARYLFGIEFPQRDLRLAVLEAAENRIGSPVDQVLMRCYRYDPQNGRYSLVVMEVLRLGGVATMLLLGGLVGGLSVAERRRRKAAGSGRPGGER